MDRDTGDIAIGDLNLAGVQTAADLDAEAPHLAGGGAGTLDGTRRAIEGGEIAVTCAISIIATTVYNFAEGFALFFVLTGDARPWFRKKRQQIDPEVFS